MMFLSFSSSTARYTGILLAGLLAASMASNALAQHYHGVGPTNPADLQRPKKENPSGDALKEKFGKWFGKRSKSAKDGEELEVVEVRKGAGMPGQFDTVKVHRQKGSGDENNAEPEELDNDALVQNALQNIEAQAAKPKAPSRPPLLAQPRLENPVIAMPMVEADNPPEKLPALDNPGNPYGITAAEKQLNDTAMLIEQGQLATAEQQLNPLKDWLVQSTEAHIGLYKALNKIPSAQVQSELEKQVALEFGQMRDKALFQLARIYQNKNDNLNAIKLYVEVIKSQPSSQIGLKSYTHLQEMGFTQKLQLVAQ